MAEIGQDLYQASELLKAGKLVAIPTETVYGLAANALDEQAVLSVFTAKQRPFFDPLIVHVADLESAKLYAEISDPRLLQLATTFWPGPLTLLFPKKDRIPDMVTSGLPQVAIRVPKHPLTLALLKQSQLPLAAPSANPFGYVSPTTAQHVNDQLGKEVQYILDGGACEVGLESTIVGIEEGQLCLYRLGGLSVEAIEAVAGPIELRLNVSSNPKAPGQLKNHYAPRKPLLLGDVEVLLQKNGAQKIALITYNNRSIAGKFAHRFVLSQHASDSEAALSLFRSLREADQTDADVVIAELVPEHGLGRAINDRLRRAAAH